MKKYRYTALLTFIISLMMVVSVVFPTVASAEDSMTSSATQETTHQDTAEQLTAQDTADELTKKDTADQLITSSPAFDAEKTVDGVKVKVSADASVFPEGTTMEVKKVTLTSQEKKLISEKQDDNKSTIKQYSFDITMKNKDGEEIEPDTSKGKVKVTFENELVKNFTTNVYHLDDNKKVDKLKLTKSKDQVTGETTGFSTYILEFKFDMAGTEVLKSMSEGESINISDVINEYNSNFGSFSDVSVVGENQKVFDSYFTLYNGKTENGEVAGDKYLKVSDNAPSLVNNMKFTATIHFTWHSPFSSTPYERKFNFTIDVKSNGYKEEDSWLNDFITEIDDTNKIIWLTNYIGKKDSITIKSKAKSGTYSIGIKSLGKYKSVFYSNGFIKNVTFEKGVIAGEDLEYLFANTSKLESVKGFDGLDTKRFKTSKLMFMFFNSAIYSLDLNGFNPPYVTSELGMFASCFNLTTLNISDLKGPVYNRDDTSVDINGLAIFNDDNNLNTLTLGKNWMPYDAFNQTTSLKYGLTGNWQLESTKAVYSSEMLQDEYDGNTMSGTYVRTTLPPSGGANAQYVVDGYQKKDNKKGNMWEVHTPSATFHGYCLNHDKETPSGYFDKVEIDINATESTKKVDSNGRSNYIMDYLDSTNYGYKELAPNMAKALVTLIYFSEYAAEGKDKVYDQNDIWHFTNEYSYTMSSTLKAKINGHTYSDIGKEYKLYIYVPSKNNKANNASKKKMQNLLSIEGAVDQPYAGVSVQKVDNTEKNNPVAGATFRVYKATKNADGTYTENGEKFGNGETYLEFTTSSNGIGSLPRMDSTFGLPVGSYILREYEAPPGYKKNDTPYTFDVTKDDDQKLIKVGDEKGVIVDDVLTDYSGGGITLKKVDSTTNKGLANAEFTLYKGTDDDESNKVKTYTTDSNGVLTTGSQDLEIGQTYILKETKAPEGYEINQDSTKQPYKIEITLTESDKNQYKDYGTVEDTPKTATFDIETSKILKLKDSNNENIKLEANAYEFQLLDSNGKLVKTAKNNEKGEIEFKDIPVSASNMPAVDYQIKEVKGTNPNIEYDAHIENVRVYITVNKEGKLVCTPEYDSDGAVFVNTKVISYSGQLIVKKKVEGLLADKNKRFDFNLYLTSDSADLQARKFNYSIDDTSTPNTTNENGEFTFNFVEKVGDKYKYKSQKSFELKDGSKLVLSNLPVGTTYEVKEDDYSDDGYITTSVNNYEDKYKTEIGENVNGDVVFTNTRNYIVPTSADTFTRSPFWITIALGALVVIYIKKRKKKINDK